tara:strand:+ start:3260 stop:4456 length:1197 start_codon:yes stop_codon:yes gene_type:complete
MNSTRIIDTSKEEEILKDSLSEYQAPYSGKANSLLTRLKETVRSLPFFPVLDYYRRKIIEAPFFDPLVRPLADALARWPQIIELDITNRCNAKCVWCPNPELEDLGAMSMSLFRKIIDDYSTRGGVVRFGTFGEPLMDKTFSQKIEYLRRFSSIRKVEVVNNGFFLNERLAKVFLDNQVDTEISLDELDKDTFEDVKKMSYDMVRENIFRLLEMNQKIKNPINVNLRIKSSLNREETINHEFFQKLLNYKCFIELTPIEEDSITSWAGRFDNENFYKEYMRNSAIQKRFNPKEYNRRNSAPCNQLWKWMVIYWDGSVVPCCLDMFSSTVLGNLEKNSIEEIWTGPAYTKFRNKMTKRQRFDIPICQDCDLHLGWQNLKNHYLLNADGTISYPDQPFVG